MVAGLAVGRIVHYVIDDGPHPGECRAAIIVRVFDRSNGYANLYVFYDGTNDGEARPLSDMWKTSRLYDENNVRGTWHYPERVE